MRNFRIIMLLLLLVLLAAGANVALYFGSDVSHRTGRAVLADITAEVSSIRVSRKGSPTTTLENRTGDWRIVEPYPGSADSQVVLRLLDALTQTPVIDVLSDSELLRIGRTRSDFSLEEPVVNVTWTLSSGATGGVSFGSPTPANDGIYAAVDGIDAVFVAKTSVLAAVDVAADGFRRRAVFPVGAESVLSFEIKREGSQLLEFVCRDTGWTVGGEKASSQKIAKFIGELTSANAVSFVWPVGASNETDHASTSLLAVYGLEPDSAVTVTLNDVDGTDRRISFGKNVGDGLAYALVENGGAIVTVPVSLRDFAAQDAVMFTDSRIFPIEARVVENFSIAGGDGLCSLSRGKDGGWSLESPIVAPADQAAVEAVLSRILTLSPADVIAEGGVSVAISTNMTKVRVPQEAVFGKYTFEDLRSREMLRIDPAIVKRIVSMRAGVDSASVVYDRDRRQWNVENGAEGQTADAKGIETVLAALSPLAALHVVKLNVAAADLDSYGLDHPFLTLAIDRDSDDAVRRNVLVGKRTEGGRFATIGSSDAIFIVPDAAITRLSASVVGK